MDDGFDNSWTGATVQKSKGNKFAVEYSAFVDDKVRARVVRVVRVVRVRANPNPNPNPNPSPSPSPSPNPNQAQPYVEPTNNTLAVVAQLVIMLLFLGGFILSVQPFDYDPAIWGWILFLTGIFVVTLALWYQVNTPESEP